MQPYKPEYLPRQVEAMNHGSLFSGIGGFDLAAEWMGWNNTFHCEWMPFPRKVLSHYFPNSISYEDITKTDFSIHRGSIQILTGGFPCQPYSTAGKRLGKEDERHLWPHMLRAISEIKPTYVVGENVRGLTNWNGGVVFEEVCTDLEAQGYEVQPILLPACAVGAPHRRDRVWFVAYSKNIGPPLSKTTNEWREYQSDNRNEIWNTSNTNGISRITSNSNSRRLERSEEVRRNSINAEWESEFGAATNSDSIRQHKRECDNEEQPSEGRLNALNDFNENVRQRNVTNTTSTRKGENNGFGESGFNDKNRQRNDWNNFPTQSPICGGDDGLPTKLDGITFSKWRNESIKGYGNAICPQVAYEIFKVIQRLNDTL